MRRRHLVLESLEGLALVFLPELEPAEPLHVFVRHPLLVLVRLAGQLPLLLLNELGLGSIAY